MCAAIAIVVRRPDPRHINIYIFLVYILMAEHIQKLC